MAISLISIFIVLLLPHVCPSPMNADMWCNQTPYPQECKYHIPKLMSSIISSQEQFLMMAEKAALQEMSSALEFTKSLGPKVINNAEESAWRNCLFFYDQTVYRLNKTLDTTTASTPHDIQTWLTAAATNIRTCIDGFLDVHMTNNIYSLVVANNGTQLISNCLAVNMIFIKDIKHDFVNIATTVASPVENPDCVVAKDGSGNYTTIMEAVDASSQQRKGAKFVIYVKQGTYNEIVNVTHSNIVLLGDGIGKTVITGNLKKSDFQHLIQCATFKVTGDGFKAVGITFENTAGVDQGQAVAMASTSDRSVFYNCSFKGYQDTLYAHSNNQFYKNCEIYGTVDFIFGNAAAVFQDCAIYALKPSPQGSLVATAQGRQSSNETSGFTIHRGSFAASPELQPFPQLKAFLGRPWGDYSLTVYVRCKLGDLVDPAGWRIWEGAPPSRYSTLYYGEFENKGAGASTAGRVKWAGYHIINDLPTAEGFDVTNLIDGQSWLPATGVPFDAGV